MSEELREEFYKHRRWADLEIYGLINGTDQIRRDIGDLSSEIDNRSLNEHMRTIVIFKGMQRFAIVLALISAVIMFRVDGIGAAMSVVFIVFFGWRWSFSKVKDDYRENIWLAKYGDRLGVTKG